MFVASVFQITPPIPYFFLSTTSAHRLEQLHVVEGALVCTNCGREYPIKDGIPNMLLNDGEI